MRQKLITALLVLLALFLMGCSQEECKLLIGEYTQQLGNDVIKKVRTFQSKEKPDNYKVDGTIHIFIVEGGICE